MLAASLSSTSYANATVKSLNSACAVMRAGLMTWQRLSVHLTCVCVCVCVCVRARVSVLRSLVKFDSESTIRLTILLPCSG